MLAMHEVVNLRRPERVSRGDMADAMMRALNVDFEAIWELRQPFLSLWRDLCNLIAPMRGVFSAQDVNQPKSTSKILDAEATQAWVIARAGLLGAMASPGRPWYGLSLIDEDPSDTPLLYQRWLQGTQAATAAVLKRSNFYQSLGELIGDELVVATGAMGLFEDRETVVRTEHYPIGSYSFARDPSGRPHIFVRELTLTLRQLLGKFGEAALKQDRMLVNALQLRQFERRFTIRHMIMPNPMVQPGNPMPQALPYAEVYWLWNREQSAGHGSARFSHDGLEIARPTILRRSGYHEFPILIGTWGRNDLDTFGTFCPAIEVRGHIRGLQEMERKSLNALAKMVDPALVGPPGLKQKNLSLLPGRVSIDPGTGQGNSLRPLHDTLRYPIDQVEAKQDRIRAAIRGAFHVPLFRALQDSLLSRSQLPTATHVEGVISENQQLLGPIQEGHENMVFTVGINRTVGIMARASARAWGQGKNGLLPLPPKELQGRQYQVDYTSELAQSARRKANAPVLRSVGTLIDIGTKSGDMSIMDNVSTDRVAKAVLDGEGTGALIGNTEDERDQLRAARAEQERAAAMAEAAPGAARAAKDLSSADVGGGRNALQLLTQPAA